MIYFSDFGTAAAGSIAFVGETTYNSAVNSAITFNTSSLTGGDGVSTSIETGDLIIFAYACGVPESYTFPLDLSTNPGFTDLVALQTVDSISANCSARLRVYSMIAASPGTIAGTTSTFANSFRSHAAILLVFRGVHSSVTDATTQLYLSGDNQMPDPAAITPATAGAIILTIGMTGATVTNPDNYNTPSDLVNFSTTFKNLTNDVMIGAGLKRNWASGSFNPEAWTVPSALSGGSFQSICATIALKPA